MGRKFFYANGMRPQLFLLYSLIIHSSMNFFSQRSRQFILSFFQVFEAWETIFHSFNMAKPATFFRNLSGKQITVNFWGDPPL